MHKQTYRFVSRYEDVDFAKIIAENPDADFIRVEWPWEEGKENSSLVIATSSGIDRLKAVDMSTPGSYAGVRISMSGVGWRHDPFGRGKDEKIHVFDDSSKFDRAYALLRERECRKRKITVTAIR